MRIIETQMTFLTPAFLGNAEQQGQWRTPPIKALLRQWWRVAYAADQRFQADVRKMRHEEGLLFGHAWLEDDKTRDGDKVSARKSEVRIRLDRWNIGTLRQGQWTPLEKVRHPDVPQPVSADLYMGYGPVILTGRRQQLKANAAIQTGEHATLSLAVPDDHAPLLLHALWLMDRYGTLGSRSRNAWGSFTLIPKTPDTFRVNEQPVLRSWQECLGAEWPHAIGKDKQGPLIWETQAMADWKALMVELAKLKIALRTHFPFTTGKNAPRPEDRHWLSYPVTNHSVKPWGGNARLPNMLRFKVRATTDGKLVGVLYLVPFLPPAQFRPERPVLEQVWSKAIAFLDQPNLSLHRIPA